MVEFFTTSRPPDSASAVPSSLRNMPVVKPGSLEELAAATGLPASDVTQRLLAGSAYAPGFGWITNSSLAAVQYVGALSNGGAATVVGDFNPHHFSQRKAGE